MGSNILELIGLFGDHLEVGTVPLLKLYLLLWDYLHGSESKVVISLIKDPIVNMVMDTCALNGAVGRRLMST